MKRIQEVMEGAANGRLRTSHHLRIYQVLHQTTGGLEGKIVSRTTDTIVTIVE